MRLHPEAEAPEPSCAEVVDAVSARLDGEPHPLPAAEVARHLTGCASCTRFRSRAVELAERTPALADTAVPDLAPTILAALTEDRFAREHRRTLEFRWLVALAGVVQFALAWPALAGSVSADLHVGRDLGVLQLALGVGFVLAAWQPQRSAGVLPIAVVVAVAAVTVAAWDVASGLAPLGAELTHLVEVVGVLALWVLRRRVPTGPPSIRASLAAT